VTESLFLAKRSSCNVKGVESTWKWRWKSRH